MKKYKMVINNKNGDKFEYNSDSVEYLRKQYRKQFYTGNDMNTRILNCTVKFYEDGYEIEHLF
jgi:hypothetical protein